MIFKPLSVNPSGAWTRPQVAAVLDIIGPEADEIGLFFAVREIARFGGPQWYEIVTYCKRHRVVVEPDSACRECLRRS